MIVKISDNTLAPGELGLSAISNDETLVPIAGLNLGGVASDRTLTITPVANRSGSAVVTLQLSDGNSTVEHPINVTVEPVNDAPGAALAARNIAAKPGETVTVNAVVAEFHPNGATPSDQDESGQSMSSIQVKTDRPELFATQPSVDGSGTLQFQLTDSVNEGEVASIELKVRDDGGTANGGTDTSEPYRITVTAGPVTQSHLPGSDDGIHSIPTLGWKFMLLLMVLLGLGAGRNLRLRLNP